MRRCLRVRVHRHHRPLQKPGLTNGLDEERALEHVQRIRESMSRWAAGFASSTGIEVDILADGALDLDDEVLAEMDVGHRQRPHSL